MNYFALQVKTRSEDKYLKLARDLLESRELLSRGEVRFLWPRRRLTVRKKGKDHETLAPIFPGYLFLETETVTSEVYWTLKRINGFFRFLKDNHHIEPLEGKDRELLLHFLGFGEVVEKSEVYYDINNRIRVVEGPMKGFEGKIVKVDKRKGRARVRLNLYEDSFLIDFGFSLIESAGSL